VTEGHVTLTYDIGPGRGLGHRHRMESLAAALDARGLTCNLVPIAELRAGSEQVVVVDSYAVRADRLGPGTPDTVVAIDDLERDLEVSLLVDPNPGCDPGRHTSAGRVLAGPAYALIGPVPSGITPVPLTDAVERVLVAFGAAGADGYGAAAAREVAALLPGTEVRLVVGPWGAEPPPGVIGVDAPDGLFHELALADMVITAGGVTLLEAIALGRPTIAVATADNQRRSVAGVAAADAAIDFLDRPRPDTLALAAEGLAHDADARRRLAANSAAYVDLDGPVRVAEAVHALL
jgi:spore coat polysaccharide biosynthesis predicted glycosyltransferase SpsG